MYQLLHPTCAPKPTLITWTSYPSDSIMLGALGGQIGKVLTVSDTDEIIANTKATMAMENMSLTFDDENRLRDCLTGKKTFEEAIAETIAKFKVA